MLEPLLTYYAARDRELIADRVCETVLNRQKQGKKYAAINKEKTVSAQWNRPLSSRPGKKLKNSKSILTEGQYEYE